MYFILALALILHLTILDHIKISGVKPDLLLIAVIFFGLFLGRGAGLESGFAAGLFKDLFALDFFGINALVFALTGFLAGLAGARFSRESKKTQILLVVLLTAFSMALHFMIVSIFSKWIYLDFSEYLAGSIIPTCIYTAIVSIPVFFKLMKVYNIRGSEEYL
jgi:rod shape-determining protein MreD